MSPPRYDAIIVGARCAGAPLAMLLARRGARVLLLDRATFPSDTVSTHVVHPPGMAALRRWGLAEALAASGCPPIDTYAFDFGAFTIAGAPGTEASPLAYCPRRSVLDTLLVDAAVRAGAELREGFAVDRLLVEDGAVVGVRGHDRAGAVGNEHARVVIGADGRGSMVARAVGAPAYHERPPLLAGYYAYWSGLPMDGRFETYIRPNCGFGVAPTHDGLTMVVAGRPYAEFADYKRDLEGGYLAILAQAPAFAERLAGARRESRLAGAAVPNWFRRPYGPGWALVGDAGYNKDPITAQGISDAFADAERCARALHAAWDDGVPYAQAMAEYQRERDEHALPMYEMTCQLAALQPPPPEVQRVLGALPGNRAAMDDFVRMNAGTLSPAAFWAPANVAAILGTAALAA